MLLAWPEQLRDLLVDIEQVTQHPDNPNNGDPELIAEMIEVNGFYAPVAVQRSTGYICAGNHRYEALLSLGSTVIPVVYMDWDDDAAKRVLLGDNKSTRLGAVDPAQEVRLLRSLLETERSLLGTGSSVDDILRLERSLAAPLAFTPPPDLDTDLPGHGMAHRCPRCGEYFG